MLPGIEFLSVKLRAMAQATEIEDRVLKAMALASGTDAISVSRVEGHFGTPITVFEADLKKSADIRRFIRLMTEAGVFRDLKGGAGARTDEECTFHFRLDKQMAHLGELKLAEGKDIIDVKMKIGVYPAKREEAARLVSEWLSQVSGT